MRLGDQWRFTFLHRLRQMTGAVDWRAGDEGPENQLWRMNLAENESRRLAGAFGPDRFGREVEALIRDFSQEARGQCAK